MKNQLHLLLLLRHHHLIRLINSIPSSSWWVTISFSPLFSTATYLHDPFWGRLTLIHATSKHDRLMCIDPSFAACCRESMSQPDIGVMTTEEAERPRHPTLRRSNGIRRSSRSESRDRKTSTGSQVRPPLPPKPSPETLQGRRESKMDMARSKSSHVLGQRQSSASTLTSSVTSELIERRRDYFNRWMSQDEPVMPRQVKKTPVQKQVNFKSKRQQLS